MWLQKAHFSYMSPFKSMFCDLVLSSEAAGTQPKKMWLIILFYEQHNGMILFSKEM